MSLNGNMRGVKRHGLGLQGVVYETTIEHQHSCTRHATILEAFDARDDSLPAGARVLLSLLCNDGLIALSDLRQATSPKAEVYQDETGVYLEWSRGNGWRARLIVSETTREAANDNRGCFVREADWQVARKWLACLSGVPASQLSWQQVSADAMAWWLPRMNGPIFAHVVGDIALQPLPRAALARLSARLPQAQQEIEFAIDDVDRVALLIQTARSQTNNMRTLEALKEEVGVISRRKQAKDTGRENVLAFIERNLDLAAVDGPAQLHVLAGVHHIVRAGGISGGLLAPGSLYDYLSTILIRLATDLAAVPIQSLGGDAWHAMYSKLLEATKPSRRPGARAFLEAFHRFMVILGAEPLCQSLVNPKIRNPPLAAVVWEHERIRAIDYIWCTQHSDRVKRNATFGILLGDEVPIRISELWNLRFGDIDPNGVTISIFPRGKDGKSKVTSLRREEDIHGVEVTRALLDIYRERQAEHALPDDVLLGIAGYPGQRFEEADTTELMNAALRYSTGDPRASYHDLRHTAFSRRSEPVLRGDDHESDAQMMMVISSQGGHAGPMSTATYQHWIEGAIAAQARQARLAHWLPRAANRDFEFEDVSKCQVAELAHLFPPTPPRQPVTARDLSLLDRAEMLYRIAQRLPIECAFAVRLADLKVVTEVVDDMAQALVRCGMASEETAGTPKQRMRLIENYFVWARAARQTKHDSIVARLSKDLDSGGLKELGKLWSAWDQCRFERHLSVDRGKPASKFIRYLLSSGFRASSMVLIRSDPVRPLAPDVEALRLDELPVRARGGRAANRLQMSDIGVLAKDAEAASLSVIGFHWWMLILWTVLKTRGELE